MSTIEWLVAVLVSVFVLDRLLLWIESRGWINYRRRGFIQELQQARYENREEQDESGDPPA